MRKSIIFKEKKPGYRKLVLEVLFKHGPLTAWGIAERIETILDAQWTTDKIYRAIRRKKYGALLQLKEREYILF
ncbi:unnamed protein product, partial [marine sediment metagenome]